MGRTMNLLVGGWTSSETGWGRGGKSPSAGERSAAATASANGTASVTAPMKFAIACRRWRRRRVSPAATSR